LKENLSPNVSKEFDRDECSFDDAHLEFVADRLLAELGCEENTILQIRLILWMISLQGKQTL
jgi:hypothetical protein